MAADKEAFLSRWSRRKQEQAREESAVPAPGDGKQADAKPPELPPVDKLTPESDFAPFMHPKVAQAVRRVALKKLFADPHFNVPDLNEAYSGDWTGGDPISEELLKTLNQARTVLYREEEAAREAEARAAAERESAVRKDGAAAQSGAADKPKEEDGTGRQDA
jgi:hypothetical protein